MFSLQFPEFHFRVIGRGRQRYIFDRVRRRYVKLTPEEWVRQHLLYYLIDVAGYPTGLMAVEKMLPGDSQGRRADVVVYDPAMKPWMIVECKSPDVTLSDEVFMQMVGYNFPLQARYLLMTNGHLCWGCDCSTTPPCPLQAFPPWPS